MPVVPYRAGMSETTSETLREIESQPDLWERAAAEAPDLLDALPASGARTAAVGCGTSWFICEAYAALREAAGHGDTDAVTASEFPAVRAYDRALLLSRSGTTTEVVRLAGELRGRVPTVAVSAVPEAPLADAVDASIFLPYADEVSVVQTRFATTALALLRASLGEDLGPAIADARRAVAQDLPTEPAAFDHFVFLGHGWSVGLAHEAALKLREAAQAHTEAYPAMEYRHGPISLGGPRSLVWVLGTPDPSVADAVRATGATVRTAELDPMAELVLIQRTAVALAASRGLDPDRPRNLTRSVVLP